MEPFQAKKIQVFGKFNYLISFGNLDDLKRTTMQEWDCNLGVSQQRRLLRPGNYVFSKLSNEESNFSLVIHHENVDPKAILAKLHEKSMEMATKPADVEETQKVDYGDGTSKIGNNIERCDICDKTGVRFDHPPAASITDYYVMHKIYDARIQHGDNPDEAKSKAAKYSDLYFAVIPLNWMNKTEWKLAPIDDGKTYQLEFQDGEKIGYAFDVKQYFGEENVRGMLLQDSSDHSVIALILESENANLRRPEVFVHPMSEFFYESEYRRFVVNGQKQVNPYFGAQDDRSPFTYLPPNLFVKIVSYLSLKERVLVRRVSQRWLEISNDVLAVGTKQIDLQRDRMIKNWTNADLNRMIPLMAGGLESMTFPNSRYADPVDFDFIHPDVSFRSLRKLDIGHFALDYNLATILMEKAPSLKKFAGNIRLDGESVGDQRHFKSVEELVVGRHGYDGLINTGDSYLMALIELFPNIRRLSLRNSSFVSASAASAMAERLGSRLEELKIDFAPNVFNRSHFVPPLGVFDGIGSCVNLKTLVLVNSHYVSNGFTQALANGCPQLETLDLTGSLLPNGSLVALEKLAALPNLTKLNVTDIEGVSDALMPVVRQGRLEQLLLRGCLPSVELINACIRYCTDLLLLDVRNDEFTTEDAIEILTMYGRYGCTQRTVIRTVNPDWRSSPVHNLQVAIRDGDGNHRHCGSFVIDMRYSSYGFVENAAEQYAMANPYKLLLRRSRR